MEWWSFLFPPPPACWFCGAPVQARFFAPIHKRLCASCRQKAWWIDSPRCDVCGRAEQAGETDLCRDCQAIPEGERVVNRSVMAYTEWSKRWVKMYKFRGKERLALPMGRWMAETVRKQYSSTRFTMVTYVPLDPERLSARGFNQSERLAAVIGKTLRLPVVPLLERAASASPQSRRSRTERLGALENAFFLRKEIPRLSGETVLLVDDVYTTGATVRACAKPLRSGGAQKILAITFARSVSRGIQTTKLVNT